VIVGVDDIVGVLVSVGVCVIVGVDVSVGVTVSVGVLVEVFMGVGEGNNLLQAWTEKETPKIISMVGIHLMYFLEIRLREKD